MKKICREQYEKDFDEMFKLDKTGLMTDVDCYVSILQEKANKYDKLVGNWNQLEEWLKEFIKDMENTPVDSLKQQVQKDSFLAIVDSILSKIKEIEGSDNNG